MCAVTFNFQQQNKPFAATMTVKHCRHLYFLVVAPYKTLYLALSYYSAFDSLLQNAATVPVLHVLNKL